jgi:hypothetical protein
MQLTQINNSAVGSHRIPVRSCSKGRQDDVRFEAWALQSLHVRVGFVASIDLKCEPYVANGVFDGIRLHLKTKFPAHFQHHGVFLEDLARNGFESF